MKSVETLVRQGATDGWLYTQRRIQHATAECVNHTRIVSIRWDAVDMSQPGQDMNTPMVDFCIPLDGQPPLICNLRDGPFIHRKVGIPTVRNGRMAILVLTRRSNPFGRQVRHRTGNRHQRDLSRVCSQSFRSDLEPDGLQHKVTALGDLDARYKPIMVRLGQANSSAAMSVNFRNERHWRSAQSNFFQDIEVQRLIEPDQRLELIELPKHRLAIVKW